MPQVYALGFRAGALRLVEERVSAGQCSGWVACTGVGQALGGILRAHPAQLVEAQPHR